MKGTTCNLCVWCVQKLKEHFFIFISVRQGDKPLYSVTDVKYRHLPRGTQYTIFTYICQLLKSISSYIRKIVMYYIIINYMCGVVKFELNS